MQKVNNLGELWDRVILPNGMMGYVFQNYLRELPNVQIEEIKISNYNAVMKKAETQKLTVEILPEEAKEHEIEYSSSNPAVINVDGEGNLLALKSGKAIITVKARENNVSSSIEIESYTPVTDMQVNANNVVLQEEDQFVVTPVIFPVDADNKNVIYSSDDENIAIVDSVGNITAVKEGNTKIIVKTEEGSITREISVLVVKKLGDNEISFDESLNINHNEITGWNIDDLTVESIKNKIQTSYHIEVYDNKGNILTDDKLVGTGSKIKILDENDVIKMEYYIIIYGDVNGDGKINSLDLLVVQRHILEIERLSGIFLKAGNINKNGKNPSSLDLLIIQRHILTLKLIDQK